MNFAVFHKGRDLQQVAAILHNFKGQRVDDVIQAINDELEKRHKPASVTPGQKECPHCGTIMIRPCSKNQVEGLIRVGCNKCFYSELVD